MRDKSIDRTAARFEVHGQHVFCPASGKKKLHALCEILFKPIVKNNKGCIYGDSFKFSDLTLENSFLLRELRGIFARPVPPVEITGVEDRFVRGRYEKSNAFIG